jgi:hypothetical protein
VQEVLQVEDVVQLGVHEVVQVEDVEQLGVPEHVGVKDEEQVGNVHEEGVVHSVGLLHDSIMVDLQFRLRDILNKKFFYLKL